MTSLKVTLLPSALFLLVPCILPESPLWLIRFDLMKKMSLHRNDDISHILIRKGRVEKCLSIEIKIVTRCLTSWSGRAKWRKVARWFSGFEDPTTPLSRRSKRWRQLPGDLTIIIIRFTFSLSSKRWRQLSGEFSILVISRWYQYCGHHTVIWLCKHNLL